MVPPSGESAALPIRWWTTLPLLLLLAVAAYALLPRLTELEAAGDVLRRLRPWVLLVALLAQAASLLAGAYMVHRVARLTGDRLSLWHSVRLGLAASAVGLVAAGPVGYAAATVHWLKRRDISEQGRAMLGWLPALLNATMLVLLAVLGGLLLVARGVAVPWGIRLALFAFMALLLGAIVVPLVASEQRLARVIGTVRRAWARVRRKRARSAAEDDDRRKIRLARRTLARGAWRGVVLGSVLRALFDALSLFILFLAAGSQVALVTMFAGYALPQVIGRVIAGGVGLVEGGMVGLYVALGVASSTAVVVVLAYRAISFWLPLALGIPFAIMEQRAARRAA